MGDWQGKRGQEEKMESETKPIIKKEERRFEALICLLR